MIILGIDPGVAVTGYGLIQTGKNNKLKFINYGCIRSEPGDLSFRLAKIYRELRAIIKKYKPHHIAIEEVFFSRNAKTALTVGQSRGVVLLAAANSKKQVFKYTPLQVKQSVAGHGMSKKKKIQDALKEILDLTEIPRPDDAADALAVALTHALAFKNGIRRRG